MNAPRGLSIQEAATYAGCKTVAAYRARARKGLLPRPMPGTHSYDRRAIDAALDRLSGFDGTVSEQTPYQTWKRQHASSA